MSGITKEYYTYFTILVSQSGQNGGGPFQSIPSSLLGNMINTTNEDNFPLGYFHISETDTFTIDLVKKTKITFFKLAFALGIETASFL